MAGDEANNSTPDGIARAIGLTLAIVSGVFIGSSFIFKKKGLLDSNALANTTPGQGHAYLKSGFWWTGMILMGTGEVLNFMAYAFIPAILVTPLGALSVVIAAVLSSIFLKERLDFAGKVGCVQCVLGAIIIVLNAPEHNSTTTVQEFFSYVISPLFIVYSCLCAGFIFYLIKFAQPKYGDKHPIVYISICSLVGAYLVLSCQGFGSAVVYSISNWGTPGTNQWLEWEMYPLGAFVLFTIIVQINYLNKALNIFSTAVVTPVYYVFFTGSTLVTSAVLFQGIRDISTIGAISILIGFLIIVGGVSLLFNQTAKEFSALSPTESVQEPEMIQGPGKSASVDTLSASKVEIEEDTDRYRSESPDHIVVVDIDTLSDRNRSSPINSNQSSSNSQHRKISFEIETDIRKKQYGDSDEKISIKNLDIGDDSNLGKTAQ